jgi:hypothetical protein
MESREPPSGSELKERERRGPVTQRELLEAIKTHLADIHALAAKLDRAEERGVYKFYTQSFKVYELQVAVERARGVVRAHRAAGSRVD